MRLIAGLILATVLAAFAASSVAHATGSAAMTAEMIASDAAPMDMTDCKACADPESGALGIACDFVCASSGLAAVLAQQCEAIAVTPGEAAMSSVPRDFRGLTSPPAKHPPRILI